MIVVIVYLKMRMISCACVQYNILVVGLCCTCMHPFCVLHLCAVESIRMRSEDDETFIIEAAEL